MVILYFGIEFPLLQFKGVNTHSAHDPTRAVVPLPVSTAMPRMYGLRFGPSRMSLRILVSELSFQYPHHQAIPGAAHRHLRPRPQSREHQTVTEPRLGLHFVVLLFVLLLAALPVVPEAIHAAVRVAVWVAVWVALLPGAHRLDFRDHPIALESDDFPEYLTVYRSHPTLPLDDLPDSWFPDKFLLRPTFMIASKTIREPC